MSLRYIILMAFVIACDLSATISAKLYVVKNNVFFLILTFLLFGIAGLLYGMSLKEGEFIVTSLIWLILSVVTVTLVGHFVFGESLNTVKIIGIILALISFILINM